MAHENALKIEVLMSVYRKENPVYLRAALESLRTQTRPADAYLIVEDGPLTPELTAVLDDYATKLPTLRRLALPENVGLGAALKAGMLETKLDWIARMDSDDLSRPDRFAKQEAYLLAHPEVDVLGTQITEFETEADLAKRDRLIARKVPLEHAAIVKFQKRRSALNHVSVLMRRDLVLAAGNYEDALYMEDDMLWYNLISAGAKLANLDEALVDVRVGAGMYERRGGFRYLKFYRAARKKALKRGQISHSDYWITVGGQLVVALMPGAVRRFIFQKFLREAE